MIKLLVLCLNTRFKKTVYQTINNKGESSFSQIYIQVSLIYAYDRST
nr:MAG TPA: hypothetical protein [Caudoviricetes sp.]DAP63830.1 MAG TPA: hypothetical protein [Caudoviricetes sp.]DAY84521.1 MAG TPA: hypothetical protein [Caudoviricetes sp.]